MNYVPMSAGPIIAAFVAVFVGFIAFFVVARSRRGN
jgi:hypothetical protein